MSITVFRGLLNKTAEVYSLAEVFDGQGGWTESFVLSMTAKVRVSALSASDRKAAGSEHSEVTHSVYTESAIARGDQIRIGSLLLEVLAVRNPSLESHHFECDCKEIQKES